MENVIDKPTEHDPALCSLISHLNKRSTLAPIKTKQGNLCILVNMSGCSLDFLKCAEDFFANSECFQILIRGTEYYVEVLNGMLFSDAYSNSI